ncbi:hypothetical protein E1176_19355 [Fulvivirga sp. RKSG066]|uniref:hypothetical protein n=1 Tax=Fulvivirga aurantia TaxID=2529383 RepID=UPI0012BBB3B8|nr:hypothetical protein [Fulvivirga aurantia]MTI23196.1 hypothetical protein [Fulvivirga aurantia]
MKKSLSISLIFFCSHGLFAQSGEVSIIDQNVNPGGVIDELPLPPPKTEGHVYLFEDWKQAEIILKSGQMLKNYQARIDLKHKLVEIQTKAEVKVCNFSLLAELSITDSNGNRQFINTDQLQSKGKLPTGIVEVLLDKEVEVLKHHYIEIKEPTYVPAVDMGSKNKKILKKAQIYALKDGVLFKVNGKLKKNQELFGNQYPLVETFASSNKLNFKDIDDLIKIVEYYLSMN